MPLSEEKLRADLKEAMRARDALRLRVLRAVLAAVKNKSIEQRGASLDEMDLIAVIKREAKQCRETLEYAVQGGRDAIADEQRQILKILEGYQPAQLNEEELRAEIEGILARTGAASIGPLMKELSSTHAGRFDGKVASRIAADLLARRLVD